MVSKSGLYVRMLIAGSILFAFYLLVAGAMFAGGFPLWAVALITLAFVGFQYKFGKWMALRSVGATDIDEIDNPDVQRLVDEAGLERMSESLSRDMDTPEPRLMVAQMGAPNAFAVGRRNSGTVVIATELLQALDPREVEGVVAHEFAHIRNRDVVMMVMGQSVASLVGIVAFYAMMTMGRRNIGAYFLGYIASILAQMLVMVFVLAISRYREYVADADAARTIGSGEPLARALEKIASSNERVEETEIDDNVAALCIFDREHGLLQSVFATHPPTEKRIDRLRTDTH